jgi:tetratricopeptide (TPR) repeat protein
MRAMNIIGFFSFKGGVGRTALMMSVAARWVTEGKRVLVIDLDLAAPGLTHLETCQGDWIEPEWENCGVGDALDAFNRTADDAEAPIAFLPPGKLIRRGLAPTGMPVWPGGGRLYVVNSGRADVQLPKRHTTDLTLKELPPKEAGREPEPAARVRLRELAKLWRQDFADWRDPADDKTPEEGKPIDHVLIDCRTGEAELIDLALGFLADHIVVVSGVNSQNLQGLEQTLGVLNAPERAPVYQFASLATVVFSPIPADITAETEAALERGRAAVNAARRRNARNRPEPAPAIFTLPYWSRLTNDDPPFFHHPLRPAPYTEAMVKIADYLKTPHAPVMIDGEIGLREDPFADLPPWFWPFGDDEDAHQAGLAHISSMVGDDFPPERWALMDELLDGLSLSVSLTGQQKTITIKRLNQLPIDNFKQLMSIFSTESAKMAELITKTKQFPQEYFITHYQWPDALGLDPQVTRQRLLYDPLHGRGSTPSWETWPEYWVRIAREIELAGGNVKHQLRAARRAVILDPGFDGGYFRIGFILAMANREIEALPAKRRAAIIKPDPISYRNYAISLCDGGVGEFTAAEQALKCAAAMDPGEGFVYGTLAQGVLVRLGDYAAAEPVYRRGLSFPWTPPVKEQDDFAEILGMGDTASSLDPLADYYRDHDRAVYCDDLTDFSVFLLRLGRGGEARKLLEKAIRLGDAFEAFALFTLARLNRRAGAGAAGHADLLAALGQTKTPHAGLWRSVLSHDGSAAEWAAKLGADDAATGPGPLLARYAHDGCPAGERRDALIAALRTHEERYDLLDRLYDLAGWRADLRPAAREAAREVWYMPAERLAELKGGPPPQDVLDRFHPFIDGESDGAGDPRDRALWFSDV